MSPRIQNPKRAPYLSPAKVTPPPLSGLEIRRDALLERAASPEAGRVVLVHAPAGFGKTTFLSQLRHRYHNDHGMGTCWLTVDDADNDVSRFLAGLALALEHLVGTLPQAVTGEIHGVDVALSLMNRISALQQPITMFFDDFEALYDAAVLNVITRGTESLMPGSHVVIGTRRLPDIGLAKLRAKGQLTEVDGTLLRFSARETQSLFVQRRGINLTPAQVGQLHRLTEGWAAALWLALLALERRNDPGSFIDSFSGSDTIIAAYLADDVLAGLNPELKQFLLHISVLEELSPTLCNAVCGIGNSGELLEELERNNLFLVAVDRQRQLYRLHSLFRDFLRTQLRRQRQQDIRALHLAASNAYLHAGRVIPAIRHALQHDARLTALPLIEKTVDELLSDGRLRLLAGWLEQLPAGELDRHPRLKMIHAWCVTFTRGPQSALALIEDLDERAVPVESAAHLRSLQPMILAMMDRIEEADGFGRRVLAAMVTDYPFARAMLYQALAQTNIILGAHDDARRFVDQARFAQSKTTGVFGLVLAESAEAILDLMSGRLRQATARMQLATTKFEASRQGLETGNSVSGNALSSIQLAHALYEADDCEQAQRRLERYTPLVQDLCPPDAMITAHVILARIVDDKGDRDQALTLLTELETAGHRLGLARVLASARLERSRLWLADGDSGGALEQLTAAEQAYNWTGADGYWFVANDTLTPEITRLRWMVHSGEAAAAIPQLRTRLLAAQRERRACRALKLRILLAEALQQNDQHKKALRALGQALKFAQGEGFVRTFLEEGPVVQILLREIHRSGRSEPQRRDSAPADDMTKWLAGRDPYAPVAPEANSPNDPLTDKELEVLRLLALGHSNNAMAEQLFISESTVRTHLRNINQKLHAGSRTEAVAIGRRLGIVA